MLSTPSYDVMHDALAVRMMSFFIYHMHIPIECKLFTFISTLSRQQHTYIHLHTHVHQVLADTFHLSRLRSMRLLGRELVRHEHHCTLHQLYPWGDLQQSHELLEWILKLWAHEMCGFSNDVVVQENIRIWKFDSIYTVSYRVFWIVLLQIQVTHWMGFATGNFMYTYSDHCNIQ